MDLLAKVKAWFFKVGKAILALSISVAGKVVREYDDDILRIIIEVEKMEQSMTWYEKLALATEKLQEIRPEMEFYAAQTAVQIVFNNWKDKLESIDTDGDGVPDYRDLCKDLGIPPGGCVTEDGCPDNDCDGVANSEDAEPDNPDKQ